MSKTEPNDSAFSSIAEIIEQRTGHIEFTGSDGLTKREYFAAMALQGILANATGIGEPDYWAKFAVKYADSLIEALNANK